MERLPLFEKDFSKNILRPHIQLIAHQVCKDWTSVSQPGWMTGLSGIAVFLSEYELWSKHFVFTQGENSMMNSEKHSMELTKTIQKEVLSKIVDTINSGFSFPTLAAGLTGIVFVFRYLAGRGYIDKDDGRSLDELIPYLKRFANYEMENGNYDALHGGIGPIMVNLVDPEALKAFDFSQWVDSIPDPEVDFGLAHGIPSLLLFLKKLMNKLEMDEQDGSKAEVSMACKVHYENRLNFLIKHAKFSRDFGSVFPSRMINFEAQYPSRLAWCYGDPGIAMSLLQLQNEGPYYNMGIRILEKCADRRDPSNTLVIDPNICHGSSGLALMFYKAWLLSKNDKLKEAAQFWILKTLDYLEAQNDECPDLSLLNGLSGIGLVLLSVDQGYLPGWERGILL